MNVGINLTNFLEGAHVRKINTNKLSSGMKTSAIFYRKYVMSYS